MGRSCNFGCNSWFNVWMGFLMPYIIKDENGETMRVVGRQEEAKQIVNARTGWTFKCVRKPVRQIDLSQFEDALI